MWVVKKSRKQYEFTDDLRRATCFEWIDASQFKGSMPELMRAKVVPANQLVNELADFAMRLTDHTPKTLSYCLKKQIESIKL